MRHKNISPSLPIKLTWLRCHNCEWWSKLITLLIVKSFVLLYFTDSWKNWHRLRGGSSKETKQQFVRTHIFYLPTSQTLLTCRAVYGNRTAVSFIVGLMKEYPPFSLWLANQRLFSFFFSQSEATVPTLHNQRQVWLYMYESFQDILINLRVVKWL